MYNIKLPNFEGPFDLLLYFIKRDELNIYDIPISKITEEFLEYVRLMQFLDLELAGEFILMASTLMYIKTQMLLPQHENENSEAPEDPRTQLVQKLLEYKKYKDAAEELGDRYEENRYNYYRQLFDNDFEAEEHYKNASLFDLISAFNNIISRNKAATYTHVIESFHITIEEMSGDILERLKKKRRMGFFDYIKEKPAAFIVVAFLSILELIKSRKIFIMQRDNFEDIIIAPQPAVN